MSDIFVPITPTNYRDDFGSLDVEGDVYMICERVKEISPNLLVRHRKGKSEGGLGYTFVISEICPDGRERWTFGTNALDGRVIEKLQYMLNVPYEKRYAEAERLEAEFEAERREKDFEEMYEKFGGPMLPLLERTGFSQRPTSYPKRGVWGGRGSAKKS